MPIWKLEPVNLDDHHWRASIYAGPVIVRAPDEAKARGVASAAFGIAAEMLPGAEVPLLPWVYSWLVTCVRLEKSDYDEEGPDTILGPEKALSKAHPPPW
jgi:hypothetical protein